MVSLGVVLFARKINKIFCQINIIEAVSDRLKLKHTGEQILNFFNTFIVKAEHLKSNTVLCSVSHEILDRLFQIALTDRKAVNGLVPTVD